MIPPLLLPLLPLLPAALSILLASFLALLFFDTPRSPDSDSEKDLRLIVFVGVVGAVTGVWGRVAACCCVSPICVAAGVIAVVVVVVVVGVVGTVVVVGCIVSSFSKAVSEKREFESTSLGSLSGG